MVNERKSLNNSQQKVLLLCSIAQHLKRCGFSKAYKELRSEAQIKKKNLNSTLPDLLEVYCKFRNAESIEADCKKKISKKRKRLEPQGKKDEIVEADDEHKLLLLNLIAQYLNQCGFSKSFKELLSKAKIKKKDFNTTLPDLMEVFLRCHVKETDADMEDGLKEKKKKKTNEAESEHESKHKPEEMKHAFKVFKETTAFLKQMQMADMLSSWSCTDALFSWRTKRPHLIPEQYRQTLDDSWSVALSRGQNVSVVLSGHTRPFLNPEELRDGVNHTLQNNGRGRERIKHARSFMVGEYVDEMTVHHRPKENYNDFEILIERLLVKGPVVVSYDILPTYRNYEGKGIYIPTDMDCQVRTYEVFPRHYVLLTGCGLQLDGELFIEFWETMDSQGEKWGDMGFGRLARGKGLIREVIQLKTDRPSPSRP